MDQILEECEGFIGIADDITVHGCMETEHDAHPWKLMEVAQKYGLVFNSKKTQVKAPMVKFFGCLYDESGVHPDPEKVNAVHARSEMPDHREVTVPGPMNDALDPEHPWIMLAIFALRCWTISLAQAP